MVMLTRSGDVYRLAMGSDENLFTPRWIDETRNALDRVAGSPAPLVTIGGDKFFSTGLDLDYVHTHPDRHGAYLAELEELLAQVLTLPVPTVAAVSGHAFGAGALFALAHDWRVMREDRGFFCFPEIDVGVPLTIGMAALIQRKLSADTAMTAMTTGHRYPGPEAMAAGIVSSTASAAALMSIAEEKAAALVNKDSTTLGLIKVAMFGAVADRLLGR